MKSLKQAHHTKPCCTPGEFRILPATPPYEFQRREFL